MVPEFEKLQTHNCEQGNNRCMKRGRDGKLKCRVPQHPPSFEHSVKKSHSYSYEGLKDLLKLGLADQHSNGQIIPDDCLMGKHYSYPTDAGRFGIPTCPEAFVAFRSSTNVQRCD